MNYDGCADRYRRNRFAVDWILDPLANLCAELPRGARVIDLGYGTGNYVWPLWRRSSGPRFHAVDRSQRMLAQAAARSTPARNHSARTFCEARDCGRVEPALG